MLEAKAALREQVWRAMQGAGVARFPGAMHRIPNFIGAEAAAESLRTLKEWTGSSTMKANPDSPQLPVRVRALQDGKTVFMASPRLATDHPFFRLDPAALPVTPRQAASIGGAAKHGVPVHVEELESVDVALVGCVAVDEKGARLGKGGGFSDLEYAIAWEAGLIGRATVVVTTVHELQVVEADVIPMTDHDVRLDVIVTPERVIRCSRGRRTAASVRWDELTDDKIAAIPLLQRLRDQRTRARS